MTDQSVYTTYRCRRRREDTNILLFGVQTVYLLQPSNDGCEPVACKILDCDTVTQAKEKALDAIYRNTPFSQRPSVHDLDLGQSSVVLVTTCLSYVTYTFVTLRVFTRLCCRMSFLYKNKLQPEICVFGLTQHSSKHTPYI